MSYIHSLDKHQIVHMNPPKCALNPSPPDYTVVCRMPDRANKCRICFGPVNPCRYAVYYNIRNPHVRIHGPGCSRIEQHGGIHEDEKSGEWAFFATEDEAREYARNVSEGKDVGPVEDCFFCKKQGRL